MNKKYREILHLPHKQSDTRTHMPVADRAAQFAPFAALVGYGDAVNETARLTGTKMELSEAMIDQLSAKLKYIAEHLSEQPEVIITCFQADKKKSGGTYLDCSGVVKKIDEYAQTIVMQDGTEIFFEDIKDIDSSIFTNNEY